MARPTVALAIICHQRADELEAAVASAGGQEVDELLVLDMASDPPLRTRGDARVLRSERNRGAAWGRNELARHATAELLLFLDDDAVLRPGAVATVREAFASSPGVGGVALRIERSGGEALPVEQPFRRGRAIPDRATPCAYVITAASAIRRQAYLAVGGSDERLTYGSDDIELAFRLLHAGWDLLYEPAAVAEHRPSPRGRLAASAVPGRHLHHRIVLARTYLPVPVAAVHVIAWTLQSLREALSLGGLAPWWRGLGAGLRADIARRRLSVSELARIHSLGGRILY